MIQRPDSFERHEFPAGYATTQGTVRLLAAKVREYHAHPVMRARARQVLRDYGPIESMDIDGEIAAVWQFMRDAIRYVRDPLGAEHITSPVELDHEIDDGSAMEDCESLALYAATLLAAIGIPSEFEIQGRNPARPDRFTHCSLRVKNPRTSAWTSFDLVGAHEFPGAFELGDTLHTPGEPIEHWTLDGERAAEDVTRDLVGASDDDAGLFGAALGADIAQVKSVGDPIAQGAMAFGPYGALVGGLWQVGTGIAQAVSPPAAQPSAAPRPAAATPADLAKRRRFRTLEVARAAPAAIAAAGGGLPLWAKPLAIGVAAIFTLKLLSR